MKSAITTFGVCFLVAAAAPTALAGPPAPYTDDFRSYIPGQTINMQVAPSGDAWSSTPFVTIAEENTADVDADGEVGASDLALLLGSWGGSGAADVDDDGVVDAADLALVLGGWGTSPVADQFMTVDREMPLGVTASVASTTFGPITVGAGETLVMRCDVFLDSLDTYARPGFRDLSTGDIIALAHFGGYHFGSEFGSFAPFTAPDGRLERIAVFAPFDPNSRPVWAMTAKTARTGEWFTIAFEITKTTYRVLIEDSETIDMFGPGLVEIFPAGPFGAAVNDLGDPVASPYLPPGLTVNSFNVGTGADPTEKEVPGFEPTAFDIDNIVLETTAAP